LQGLGFRNDTVAKSGTQHKKRKRKAIRRVVMPCSHLIHRTGRGGKSRLAEDGVPDTRENERSMLSVTPGQADRLKRNDVCLAPVNTQCYTEMNLGSLLFSAPGSVFRHGEQKVSLCSRGQTVCMCFAYDLRPEEVIAFDERI